jgi:hypothetical protein
MGYYSRRSYRKPRVQKQDNPELVARIEKTAARGATSVMTDWERNFIASILDSAKVWGRLTAKQHGLYQNIESRLDPANIAARDAWNNSWDEEKRAAIIFAANYYKANPPYFSGCLERILNDSNYIPTEKLYRKMVENKYVQRAKVNASSGALYEAGSMVTVPRLSSSVGGAAWNAIEARMRSCLGCQAEHVSAVKGTREYTVLPVGCVEPFTTQERYLKKKR